LEQKKRIIPALLPVKRVKQEQRVMHDCRETKTKLVDLVFGEMEASEQQRALADVRGCPGCSAEYHSMLATLRMFDQAADAAMPEESYWAGYEARLRTKLAEPAAPDFRERLAGWFATLLAKPAIPATVAGLILLAAISMVWFSKQGRENQQRLVASTTPTPEPTRTIAPLPQTDPPESQIEPTQQSAVAVKVPQQSRPRPAAPKDALQDDLAVTNLPQQNLMPETPSVADPAAHLENAQMLLRSFRNAESADLAYEKRQARKLVYDNILLRREAEARGNLPVEEALNSLEPLLLDIANLPAKASRGDVQTIRERIQKQEIIATLQIVGTGAERFGAPALLNQE
jgi:hypothetical protein